ncbi:MAG: trypsin-like peptidase domain-containing protein [Rickettsiales bacterium]|jgi:serine protease Do|nr:trypsin-like peptidase domain-containing protein [Rickettsiales bacterium]
MRKCHHELFSLFVCAFLTPLWDVAATEATVLDTLTDQMIVYEESSDEEKEREGAPDIMDKILKSVVSIEAGDNRTVLPGNDGSHSVFDETNSIREVGSGFIISEDGYIVTNSHVVADADKIFINHGNDKYQAELVGEDSFQDVALLKITTKDKLPFVKLNTNVTPKLGEKVIVVGNPYNLGISVSSGIVSAVNRNIKGTKYSNLIQTDASINKGNSGGPMFNAQGDVVGISSLIFSPNNGENIGIGFAIPVSDIVSTIGTLKEFGYIRRGWLGISSMEVDEDFLKVLNSKRKAGIFVKDVVEGSPADRVGLLPSDIIVSYNNKHIEDLNQLLNMIRNSGIDSAVDILVLRNGQYVKLRPIIKDLPTNTKYDENVEKIKANSVELMGMVVSQMDKNLIEKYKLYSGLKNKGMYVLDVKNDSPAERNKIEVGDMVLSINQTFLTNKNTLLNALGSLKSNKQKEFIMIVRKSVTGKNVILRLNFNVIN